MENQHENIEVVKTTKSNWKTVGKISLVVAGLGATAFGAYKWIKGKFGKTEDNIDEVEVLEDSENESKEN